MRSDVLQWLAAHNLLAVSFLFDSTRPAYLVAVLVSVTLFLHLIRREGVSEITSYATVLLALIGGLVGSRLYALLDSGTVRATASWGAYLGITISLLAVGWTFRDARMPSLFASATAAAGVGILIGRVGACFMVGDDFGIATDVSWGVSFPPGSVAYERFAMAGLIDATATRTPPLHPLQLYLGASALLVFCVIRVVGRQPGSRRWLTAGLFFSLYGINRFALEYLRHPLAGGRDGHLSSSQTMAISFAAAGLLLLAADRYTTTHTMSRL